MSKDKKYNFFSLNTEKKQISVYRFTIYGILFGLLFPTIAWIINIIQFKIEFNIKALWEMHLDNPIIFLINIAPFVIGTIFYYFFKNSEFVKKELKTTITERNNIIQKNSEFAKKIGEGELSEKIKVSKDDVLGKSLLLMRDNLLKTYQRETEQNWIAKGKEKIGDILRYHNKVNELAYETIVSIVNYTEAVQGAFYVYDDDENELTNIATYAYNRKKYVKQKFKIGQGLIGQVAYEKNIIYRKEIPDNYTTISSGILGDKKPKTILLAPLIGDEKLQGVIELASLQTEIPKKTILLIEEISGIIAQTVFNLKVNKKTEYLLLESRKMTDELQKNEDELRKNAEKMKITQIEIEDTNKQLAAQIQEVEKSRKRLYSLLENASEVISIYDETGLTQYHSPSIKPILDFNANELIGKYGFNIYNDDANKKLKLAFKKLLDNPEKPITLEYKYTKNNDDVIWLETTGRNLLDNPAIHGIIFNTRDITVRKIADKAQRMSGQMQALSENSIDMIVRLNPIGEFFYVNPIAEKYTGVGKRNMLKKSLDEVKVNSDIIFVFKEALKKVKEEQTKYETETIFPAFDEEHEDRIVQFNAIPEYNEYNELETILFVAHDITEQKQIQLEIEKKNKSITESINYAKRIQSAILPSSKNILKQIPKSFIFYKPRDVVSGDIPWFLHDKEYTYIAVVDCTGHGVPGALLSFISYFLLNNIVATNRELSSGDILNALHQGVRKTLKQDTPDAEARDGMDIALCKINFEKKELDFSGAHIPLFHINQSGEFKQYKGALKAIGGIPRKKRIEKKFVNHKINYNLGDKIFFFSDGYPDQIGGEKGRKYKNRQIKELIENNYKKTIPELHDIFESDYYKWKGNYKQIDDILLIGIEF